MRRRRLAAELQRLRAAWQRTLEEVAPTWSASGKISRIEERAGGRPHPGRQRPAGAVRRHRGSREACCRWSGRRGAKAGGAVLRCVGRAWRPLSLRTRRRHLDLRDQPRNRSLPDATTRESDGRWKDVRSTMCATSRPADGTQHILLRTSRRVSMSSRRGMPRRASAGTRDGRAVLAAPDGRDQPNVSLRVLPFEAGPHQAMGFPFHIFEFTAMTPRSSTWSCSTQRGRGDRRGGRPLPGRLHPGARARLVSEESVLFLEGLTKDA